MPKIIPITGEVSKQEVAKLITPLAGTFLNPKYAVVIEDWKKIRSNEFNSYYWVCLRHIAMCRPTGVLYRPDSWHHYFAGQYLEPVYVYNPMTGEVELTRRSTRKLTEKQFKEYFDQIREYCWHEWAILLPEPKDRE